MSNDYTISTLAKGSREENLPMTGQEFLDSWSHRFYGLAMYARLEAPHFCDDFELRDHMDPLINEVLGRLYDSLTTNCKPGKTDFEMLDKLGRCVGIMQSMEDHNYLPATGFLDPVHVKTYKQLTAVLRAHSEIRWKKPSPQRLLVHAGDWERYIRERNRDAAEALDTVEDFAAEARRRQEGLREQTKRAQ